MDVNDIKPSAGNNSSPYIAIALGYVPAGIVFGSISFIFGIPLYYVIGLSLIVYSGAVQSAFVGFWASGFSVFGILLTAFLLNSRHSFYGAHIERKMGVFSLRRVFLVAPFITDEVYALAVSADRPGWKWLFNLSMFGYANWILSSIAGYLIFSSLPLKYLEELTIGLSALFLSLFIPQTKNRDGVIVAAVSISVALVVRISDLPDYFISVAILAGLITGAVLIMRKEVSH